MVALSVFARLGSASIVETDLSGRIINPNPVVRRLAPASASKIKHRKFSPWSPKIGAQKRSLPAPAEVLNGAVRTSMKSSWSKKVGAGFPVAIKKWLQSNQIRKS